MPTVFTVRDLIEESCLYQVYPMRQGWLIRGWDAGNTCDVLMPDFAKSFGLTTGEMAADAVKAGDDVPLGREAQK